MRCRPRHAHHIHKVPKARATEVSCQLMMLISWLTAGHVGAACRVEPDELREVLAQVPTNLSIAARTEGIWDVSGNRYVCWSVLHVVPHQPKARIACADLCLCVLMLPFAGEGGAP
jgi:hypothetical protein